MMLKTDHIREEVGIYNEGDNKWLVMTPQKTRTFKSFRIAKFWFDKWMGKDVLNEWRE